MKIKPIGIIICVLLISSVFTVGGNVSVDSKSISIFNKGSLSGYVNDASMNPIEGVRVRVCFHGTYEEDYTDSYGYYRVTNIPICYCLKNCTASKEGYYSEWILLAIDYNTTYDFVLVANHHPDEPSIFGPVEGKVGEEYEFVFSAEDPDGDNVSFYIEWQDGTSTGWTDYYSSGENVKVKHVWNRIDQYLLRCKAKDIYGDESNWTISPIRVSKNKPFIFNSPLLIWLAERFPNFFPILRILLGLT